MSRSFFKQAGLPAVLLVAMAGNVACYMEAAPPKDAHEAIDIPPEGRDGEPLVLGYRLGHSGENSIAFGAMTLDLIQGRCSTHA